MVKAAVPVILLVMFGVPFAIALGPVLAAPHLYVGLVLLFAAPALFLITFLMVSGMLSRFFKKAIIRGKFPRDLRHPVYGPRRLYGLCWTTVYYSGPIYSALLALPFLRRTMLRLFGYAGDTDFVVYPDTWIRDLPLLEVGKGAYLSNKSTIGTNICLNDGTILVDKVRIDAGAMVGHMTMLGPGAWLEEGAEVGVGVAIGLGARIGRKSSVGPCALIYHGAHIGDGVEVGAASHVGTKAKVAPGVRLPAGANIAAGAVLESQDDVQRYISSETKVLRETAEGLRQLYALRAEG